MNYYVGHPLQVRGAEQYELKGGKGEGMKFIYVRNGLGLELWISVDRCGDMARVSYNGKNMSYTSPCGQVAPAYYDRTGLNFLKSFNAGFFTTCGFDGTVPEHFPFETTDTTADGMQQDDDAEGMHWWVYAVIALMGIVVMGGILFVVIKSKKKVE